MKFAGCEGKEKKRMDIMKLVGEGTKLRCFRISEFLYAAVITVVISVLLSFDWLGEGNTL